MTILVNKRKDSDMNKNRYRYVSDVTDNRI